MAGRHVLRGRWRVAAADRPGGRLPSGSGPEARMSPACTCDG